MLVRGEKILRQHRIGSQNYSSSLLILLTLGDLCEDFHSKGLQRGVGFSFNGKRGFEDFGHSFLSKNNSICFAISLWLNRMSS